MLLICLYGAWALVALGDRGRDGRPNWVRPFERPGGGASNPLLDADDDQWDLFPDSPEDADVAPAKQATRPSEAPARTGNVDLDELRAVVRSAVQAAYGHILNELRRRDATLEEVRAENDQFRQEVIALVRDAVAEFGLRQQRLHQGLVDGQDQLLRQFIDALLAAQEAR
jgi:hypothetical protein